MKKAIYFILFLSFIIARSQDVIVKKDGTSIQAKVEEVGVEEIKYLKSEKLSGPIYSIHKSDVVIINFEDGSFELIQSESKKNKSSKKNEISKLSLKETKDLIIENINKYSFDWKFEFDKYDASFEDEMLLLVIVDQKGNKSNR